MDRLERFSSPHPKAVPPAKTYKLGSPATVIFSPAQTSADLPVTMKLFVVLSLVALAAARPGYFYSPINGGYNNGGV